MLIDNLIEKILIQPAEELKADHLRILSAFCNAAFVTQHRRLLIDGNLDVDIHLTLGWKGSNLKKQVPVLQKLDSQGKSFECTYYDDYPPIHSKIYVWFRDGKPITAFQGSCNYSTQAFDVVKQKNTMAKCDAVQAAEYIDSFSNLYKSINDYSDSTQTAENFQNEINYQGDDTNLQDGWLKISLLSRNGNMGTRSALNWGQRPGREPNQAYIPVPKSMHDSFPDFFPPKEEHFTIETVDGDIFFAVMAGDNRKHIETPKYSGEQNNSWLGKYFRKRLGVQEGEFVSKEDLENYGRTYVSLIKIGENHFQMDFSKPSV